MISFVMVIATVMFELKLAEVLMSKILDVNGFITENF